MSIRIRTCAAASAAAVVLTAMSSGVAHSAESQADDPRYCASLLSKGSPDPLVTACSNSSPQEARALMDEEAANRSAPSQRAAAEGGRTHIMTWYEGANYTDDSWEIFGEDGDCDGAGYEMHPATGVFYFWGEVMSSARGAGTCNTADFYNQELTIKESKDLPVANLGETMNDNVGKIMTWDKNACLPQTGPC